MTTRNRKDVLRIAVRQFEPFERSIAEMWDAFCQTTPCNLQLEAVPLDLHPLYDSILGSDGLRKGDWDIAQITTDWIAEAQATESLLDLKPLLDSDPPEDFPIGWSPSMLGFQDFGDSIVGVPFHDGPECLIYRKDLFEDPSNRESFLAQTGKELALPETWDAFHQLARFFTHPEQNLYGTVVAGYPDGHNTVFDFALHVWTRGGELVDDSGRVRVDTQAAHDAMRFYRDLLQDHSAIHPDCRQLDSVKSGLAFARGEVAMMVNWFGFASMSEVVAESVVKGKVDIGPIPHAAACNSASLNCYWLYAVGKGSQHARIAYDFICFMVNRKNDKRLTLNGGTGCRTSTWHDADVNREVPYYHRLEALHEHARTLPRLANWSKLAEVIDELVLSTMNTETPIEAITAKAQQRIDTI
ncbi:extracellular solute-binding protein [Novipirellula artificiosorum]|uniref:Putative ABC transporter-binding protein n=1 Tax=Novipirellula artificiosorum TaxID=2528016 RepID=A0A5C6E242_9BACT|nr:extracellular solute-binding protein [Novipirellula artificiosorum]TWU42785.1 putative ABC transporter-binding protein precursor [Novipirellula artificiosorum]